MRVQVVAHDPAWRGEFDAEAKRIARALGDIVVRMHHIGSTAIPGIFAKPIIDFLLEVQDIVELDDRSSAMEALGYEAMGEFGIPGRRYFCKNNTAGVRTHQVHAFEADGTEVEPHLAFRDYMDCTPCGGILNRCVNSQAVYPLSEQHGLKARERRYTAHEEGKHWE